VALLSHFRECITSDSGPEAALQADYPQVLQASKTSILGVTHSRRRRRGTRIRDPLYNIAFGHSNAMQYPGGADFEEVAPFSARARRSLVCWDSVTSGLVGFNSIVIVRCWSGFGVSLSVIGATAAGGAVPGCQCPRPWTGRRNPPHPPIRGRSGGNGGRRRRRSLSCPQRPGGRRR
jgi:hypothetical protein